LWSHAYALYSGDNQKKACSTSAIWAADLRQAANGGFPLILQRFSAPDRIKGHRYVVVCSDRFTPSVFWQ
jgi:hypothetical protein